MKQEDLIKQQNKEILNELKLVQQWRESTYKEYKKTLKKYTDFQNKSMLELIKEAENDEEELPLKKRKIKQRLINYQKQLIKEGLTPNTQRTHISRIKTIYNYYDIEIPKILPIQTSKTETYSDILTNDEIKHILENTTTKNRALITFMATSGLRVSDTVNLTIKDFIKATKEYHDVNTENNKINILEFIKTLENNEFIIPTWEICTKKTNTEHITFNSPEATKYILQLLKERLFKHELKINDTIFKLTAGSVSINLNRLNNRLNLGKTTTNIVKLHPHGLRKYFATTLTNNGLDFLTTEFMLGHKLKQVTASYYYANPDKIKNKYIHYLDKLTFMDKINYYDVTTKEKRELEHLRKENKETRIRITQLEEMINYINNKL